MTSQKYNQDLENLLLQLAEELDIPEHLYEDATLKYEDVGEWLAANDSELKEWFPEIYPQGSFRLGTVVRPLTREDEYDIDLVCYLQMEKEGTTQKRLKEIVGERLKKRADLEKITRPSRRCWTLTFPKQFHMDVLPAIPNRKNPPTGILLTDTELKLWQSSNPIEYAEWFKGRMKTILEERKAVLAKSLEAEIEEVPDWRVRTPLQRVVQLLKRHRDIYFQDNEDNTPASIIITTLAARAYKNERNILEALIAIVGQMPLFIENRNGEWWIPNPVDSDENFSDKWNEKPERHEAFLRWLKKLSEDFLIAGRYAIKEAAGYLSPVFGKDAMARAGSSIGIKLDTPILVPRPTIAVPDLADYSHSMRPIWSMDLKYKASVRGSVHYKKYLSRKLWDITRRPLPKKVALRFVVSTNTPKPYQIRWQVVNTGKEAALDNDLRGDFYESDDGANVRWESTKYAGTHWIEAYVIKDGSCVARSGRKYVKIRN